MFTNDSRWDRHLPHQSREEEPIEVGVIFAKAKAHPVSFVWHQRKYHVDEVTYQWQDSRGGELLHFYTVVSAGNLYQMYFNAKRMHWRMVSVCPTE